MPNHSKAVLTAKPERHLKAHRRVSAVEATRLSEVMSEKAKLAALKARTTIGLYSLRVKDGGFGVPFCAVSDHFALLAQKQLLPLSDCYKLGTVCLHDGEVTPIKPFVVLDR